ncbi:MAG: FAD-dependent oxidoreductase [Candidatus Omnitrophica bacterium]|nr:FAD-dependent oxidoreductase [Candidatus Omnitrophota bacterium]
MKKIVIIGNSAAGISAAESIRGIDKEAKITMVSDEPYLAYQRYKVLDLLEGKIKERDLNFRNQDFYNNNSIELMLEREVVELNLNKKKAVFKDRDSIEFDELVIATGSKVKLPALKGIQKEGVVALNGLKEVKFLIENLPIAHTVVVVGCGTTAINVARIIGAKKIEVKLLGALNEPIEGVEAIINNPISEILGDSEAKAVRLANNKVIGASLVIFPEPKQPSIDFVRETEIKCGNFIFVDNQMRTNIPFVFAVGDCAEFSGQVKYCGWESALKHGSMLGGVICQK